MTSLRQRMLEDLQVRNLSLHTQRAYLEQVSRFAQHFGQSPTVLGPEEIRTYQVYLTNERKLAPGSILIAVAAVRFLYKVTLKKDWPFDQAMHVLPPGFHRIRYYGLLGNRHRSEKLDRCRQLLGTASPPESVHHATTDYRDRYEALTGISLRACPFCQNGRMLVVEHIVGSRRRPAIMDTS
jgi:Phage integrase, N-terminal SAM-like domain/Putative transposase